MATDFKFLSKIGEKLWMGLGWVITKKLHAQTIPNKILGTKLEKSSKTGQEKKGLASIFVGFLTAIVKI